MAKSKIFISYDNHKHYKNMLLARDKNDEFDFAFSHHSGDVPIQSTNAEAIERTASPKINSAAHFLCIVGSRTTRSGRVTWEVDKAKDLQKKLVAVKTPSDNKAPNGLLSAGASWATSFILDAIKKSIEGA